MVLRSGVNLKMPAIRAVVWVLEWGLRRRDYDEWIALGLPVGSQSCTRELHISASKNLAIVAAFSMVIWHLEWLLNSPMHPGSILAVLADTGPLLSSSSSSYLILSISCSPSRLQRQCSQRFDVSLCHLGLLHAYDICTMLPVQHCWRSGRSASAALGDALRLGVLPDPRSSSSFTNVLLCLFIIARSPFTLKVVTTRSIGCEYGMVVRSVLWFVVRSMSGLLLQASNLVFRCI